MLDLLQEITSVRESLGLPIPTLPSEFDSTNFSLYRRFLEEEFIEETDGIEKMSAPASFIALADAMADGAVFMSHMLILQGLGIVAGDIWKEVLFSNSTKGGPNGELFTSDGKLIKGPNYKKPNLGQFFDGSITLAVDGRNRSVLVDFYQHVCDDLGLSFEMTRSGSSAAWAPGSDITSEIHISGGSHSLYSAFRGEVGRHLIDGTSCSVAAICENFVSYQQWAVGPFVRTFMGNKVSTGGVVNAIADWRSHTTPLSKYKK